MAPTVRPPDDPRWTAALPPGRPADRPLNVMATKRPAGDDAPRIVFSSEVGRTCPDCGKALAACICAQLKKAAAPESGSVAKVRRESKGRGGKTVTTVSELPLSLLAIETLAKTLRTRCSSGGTVRDGVIEVQGDHVDTVLAVLASQGIKAKKAGG
jgi:translation initiation factor 1